MRKHPIAISFFVFCILLAAVFIYKKPEPFCFSCGLDFEALTQYFTIVGSLGTALAFYYAYRQFKQVEEDRVKEDNANLIFLNETFIIRNDPVNDPSNRNISVSRHYKVDSYKNVISIQNIGKGIAHSIDLNIYAVYEKIIQIPIENDSTRTRDSIRQDFPPIRIDILNANEKKEINIKNIVQSIAKNTLDENLCQYIVIKVKHLNFKNDVKDKGHFASINYGIIAESGVNRMIFNILFYKPEHLVNLANNI